MKKNKKGYLLEISYKGKYFDAFDEIKNKITVKGNLKSYLENLGIKLIKGLQQAGRTDAKVNANSNYIYFMALEFDSNLIKLNEKINNLVIKNIKETKLNLILPDLVESREYIYFYPQKLIKEKEEIINLRCKEISGNKDFSRFTNHKGLKLKNMIRNVNVRYEDGKIYFLGDSFLPEQVRRMSGYILKGKIEPLPGKHLILNKIKFKEKYFEKTD